VKQLSETKSLFKGIPPIKRSVIMLTLFGFKKNISTNYQRIIIYLFLAVSINVGNVAIAGTINVNSCGLLNQSSTTYVLQNDVTSDGTCFFISANDVTLDLNGKTVTYDNAAPITVANGSFESATMTDWDLTGAPAATRAAGVYLERTVYEGSYALKIPTPLTQDQTITTSGKYTLAANKSYSASVMMWQPYDVANSANADVHMIIEIIKASDNTVLASRDSRDLQARYTTRGLQYVRAPYTTTAQTDVKIRLKVTGARTVTNAGQAPYGAFYFDDVRIQQTANSGVQGGGTSVQYGVSSYAWARRITVTSSVAAKGKIVQGRARGDFSHAVSVGGVPSDLLNYTVNNLEITVAGNSSKAILANNAGNGIISNNLIHGYADTLQVRDWYDGSLIHVSRSDAVTAGLGCKIFGNVITHGIQTGIFVNGSPDATRMTEIYNNDITLQSKYTNDFAIVGGYATYSANIHDNIVRCGTGNNTCRGIFIHGNNGAITSNIVDVHYRRNSQEYGLESGLLGCAGAAYGIQIDPSSSNVETKFNTVTAYADECEAAAFRFYAEPAGSTTNNLVHDNTFKAISVSGIKIAATLRILESYASDMSFTNNTLITNSTFLHIDGNQTEDANRSLLLDANAFQIDYPKSAMYYPLVDNAYVNGTAYVPRNVTISNNIYNDATVRADMNAAVFRNLRNNFLPDAFATNIIITESNLPPPIAPSLPPPSPKNLIRLP